MNNNLFKEYIYIRYGYIIFIVYVNKKINF